MTHEAKLNTIERSPSSNYAWRQPHIKIWLIWHMNLSAKISESDLK